MGFRPEDEEFEDQNQTADGIGRTSDTLKNRLQSAIKTRYHNNIKLIKEREVIQYKLDEFDDKIDAAHAAKEERLANTM